MLRDTVDYRNSCIETSFKGIFRIDNSSVLREPSEAPDRARYEKVFTSNITSNSVLNWDNLFTTKPH